MTAAAPPVAKTTAIKATRTNPRPARAATGKTIVTIVAWIVGIIVFLPILWMVVTAFKPESAAETWPPQFTFSPTLSEFNLVFSGMGPYIELGILLGSIYLVNVFDQVRLMTNGGPGTSTTTLPFYLYQKVNYAFDIGGSAAAGVVTVVLTIIVATFALRMFARVFQFEEAR